MWSTLYTPEIALVIDTKKHARRVLDNNLEQNEEESEEEDFDVAEVRVTRTDRNKSKTKNQATGNLSADFNNLEVALEYYSG